MKWVVGRKKPPTGGGKMNAALLERGGGLRWSGHGGCSSREEDRRFVLAGKITGAP